MTIDEQIVDAITRMLNLDKAGTSKLLQTSVMVHKDLAGFDEIQAFQIKVDGGDNTNHITVQGMLNAIIGNPNKQLISTLGSDRLVSAINFMDK